MSPFELAEAGFVHKATKDQPHRIQHFASEADKDSFSCTERSDNNVARFMRRIIDRGFAPLKSRSNVPLALCVSAKCCITHPV